MILCHSYAYNCVCVSGPVSMRSHPAPDSSGNTIGLEAIIRKALMGKYDDQAEERPPSSSVTPLSTSVNPAAADPRTEEQYSLPGMPETLLPCT